jgi:FkbM family methyltransferase
MTSSAKDLLLGRGATRHALRRARQRLAQELPTFDPRRSREWSMQAAIERAARHHPIAGIIDVGASTGSWSVTAKRHWPRARFLLIEAQPVHEAALRDSGFEFVLAAAGDHVGEIHFDASDPYGGVASTTPTGEHDIVVPITTVDREVERSGLPAPLLLKLDTHGFEREILLGAADTLPRCDLLVIEAYNFELTPGALRFHELCAFLEERGFRCVDLAEPLHRPKDEVFWQFDLLFARADEASFADNTYA